MISKGKIIKILCDNHFYLNVSMLAIVFVAMYIISGSIFNAIFMLAFHMLFAGFFAHFLYQKNNLSYIQFERYRDDIDVVKGKRNLISVISVFIFSLFILIFCRNINICDYIF
ncbi:hypothetical protein Deia_00359 [Candidatus Deianiraea vastatrix]|uniref:Uncharacterized protein n=2 Tax=Candidatus Deianiraea vastatrix TaxID=2163644 RepID=A0A5B8XCX8_9RICK|nr:hypothetical protein Deia_00359 [Candidatus Deianiraea vastatrix]